jgi:hypothetical protein
MILSGHIWQILTSCNYAFDIKADSWIEGFEVRFYGQPQVAGVCALNARIGHPQ